MVLLDKMHLVHTIFHMHSGYINNDSEQWRAILRRGPNYPFYSPGQTHQTEKQRQPGIWIWPGNSYGEFNPLSETDNYKNGRSLHFRFGLDGTGNWNRGIDVPAWTGLSLVDKGNDPDTSENKLGKCEVIVIVIKTVNLA